MPANILSRLECVGRELGQNVNLEIQFIAWSNSDITYSAEFPRQITNAKLICNKIGSYWLR